MKPFICYLFIFTEIGQRGKPSDLQRAGARWSGELDTADPAAAGGGPGGLPVQVINT